MGRFPIDTHAIVDGSFEPQIVRKRQPHFDWSVDNVLAIHVHGTSTRDITAHIEDLNGVEIGRALTSKVTDAVDAGAQQPRPLEYVHTVVFC